ncbi:MAG: DEAD/DEAH box helicase [Methyloprofundus sp.]|nr:DEAD/DEAH box helicase [Methyloprofundus sp.]
MLSRDNLHDYQNRAISFIKAKKRCALFLDMGLGKTTTSLTTASDLLDGFAVSKVLVIAPLRVANSVWAQECTQWQHLKHLKVSVCTGSEKSRIAALLTPADIYTINRENVPWLVKHYGKRWPFDCVIVDESSSFKNASSQRFKALKRVLPDTEYLWLLTGTPSPNSLLDLWAQLYLVDFGERLGRTITGFKQRFFESDYMGYNLTPRVGAPEKIHQLISDKCLSMTAVDYLTLPERIDLTESVSLPAKALKTYKDFEAQLFTELADGTEIEAMSAAVLANKLLQMANGAIYTDESGNWSNIHDSKLDALKELVESHPEENLLIAYNYKSDLARLTSAFPDAVVLDKEQTTIDDWNAGKTKMLFAHPASAAHGLNLQSGGAVVIWFGLNWSLELYQQFNGRLHRQGQTKPVRIVHIVADGTIDERVMTVIKSKDATQQALISALICAR